MAITLPFPVRLAAGILATGIDIVRALPEELPALPVALVGNAMRLSIKVQQEIATLATRGDELIGSVVGAPQESPTWAKFDDEPAEPVTRIAPAGKPASRAPSVSPSAKPGATGSPASAPAKAPVNTPPDLIAGPDDPTAGAGRLSTPEATAMPPVTTTAMDAAIEVADELVELATVAAQDPVAGDGAVKADPMSGTEKILAAEKAADAEEAAALGAFESGQVPDEVLDSVVIGETEELTEGLQVPQELIEEVLADSTADEPDDDAELESVELLAEELLANDVLAEDVLAEDVLADGAVDQVVFGQTDDLTESPLVSDQLIETIAEGPGEADGPAALPGYDGMTLAQVRGHLRDLSADEVSLLLRYEQDGDNRAPFLTLLSNRLVTLDAQSP